MKIKRAVGYLVDGLMVGSIVGFLASIITLGFIPESSVLKTATLTFGLGSVASFVGHIILEYLLGWEW